MGSDAFNMPRKADDIKIISDIFLNYFNNYVLSFSYEKKIHENYIFLSRELQK